MEKIVEAPKYIENFPSSVVWYSIPYVTEMVFALVAHRTNWKPEVWVKVYYGANILLYIPFIQLHKAFEHIIQGHTFFLYLFVKKKKQPKKKLTKKKQTEKTQSREAIKC